MLDAGLFKNFVVTAVQLIKLIGTTEALLVRGCYLHLPRQTCCKTLNVAHKVDNDDCGPQRSRAAPVETKPAHALVCSGCGCSPSARGDSTLRLLLVMWSEELEGELCSLRSSGAQVLRLGPSLGVKLELELERLLRHPSHGPLDPPRLGPYPQKTHTLSAGTGYLRQSLLPQPVRCPYPQRGMGFWRMQAWAALNYPGVTRDRRRQQHVRSARLFPTPPPPPPTLAPRSCASASAGAPLWEAGSQVPSVQAGADLCTAAHPWLQSASAGCPHGQQPPTRNACAARDARAASRPPAAA